MKLDPKLVALATILCMVVHTEAHLAVMAVDLGSEYMKIAIVKPGVPMEIITNEDSSRKTATIVAMRNGERMFGDPAERAATKHPSNAFWYLTQIVGKKFDDPAVQVYRKRFPYYDLVKDEERGTVLFKIDDETTYSPEELLAMILEKARHYAETFADQPIKDAVITVPSFFSQAERRAVQLAADLAGINALQILGDNAAVALNYGVFRRKQFTSDMQYIMFYDMGATSTTATIVGYQVVSMKEGTKKVENPQLVIKGVGFDKQLGGLEISIRLRNHLAEHFAQTKKTKSDLYSNHRAMAKLLKEAKRVKKVLSANNEHMAQVEGLLDDEDFKMLVQRSKLEELCADMWPRVTKPIEDALKASEITLAEISDVILMGGGSRIPKVQEILTAYLGKKELGKSINTDEAAAMGAVYQAAHLGKGFKVLTFGVKEANIYPIVVEFEKYRSEETVEPPKVIKRTLFGRMNPYPQKKVMTFNKHFKDFSFNVSYGELDFMPEEEAMMFRQLQGMVHQIDLKGVEDAYAKHTDAQEAKGIKAHFKMDESGILTLDLVETIFEKEVKEVKEESTWSKLGDTISGLFGSSDTAEGVEANKTAESSSNTEPAGDSSKQESTTGEPVQAGTGSEESKENQKPAEEDSTEEVDSSSSEEKQQKETTTETPKDETKDKAEDETKDETKDKTEETAEKADKDTGEKKESDGEKKSEEKAEDKEKKDKEAKEEGATTTKVVIVKENITVETNIADIPLLSKDQLKASRKKLSNLTAKDKEKKLLEKAKNEIESYIYDMGDKLTLEIYEKSSKEEEREAWQKLLAEASDWLYEQEEDAKKEVFIDKLKEIKKEFKQVEFRVKQHKERPEALATLKNMLNQSQFFLVSLKNASALIDTEEKVFTDVEIETLEKLINDTEDWLVKSVKEQEAIPDHEKPTLLLEDIAIKMQALDREVKYLLNKAKTFRPKAKPKTAKNKTEDKNKTGDTADDTIKTDKDSSAEETSSTKPDVESEIPAPPTDDTTTDETQEEQPKDTQGEDLEDADKTTEAPTQQPPESNTHDAGDL